MINLVFGKCDLEIPDLLLETDLGSPVQGPPGVVSLSCQSTILRQYFIGYSSPKHNTQKYLFAVHECFHRFRSEFSERNLLVHCHNWKSGIGRVLLSDIIRITQPCKIVEYYDKAQQIEMVMQENISFLDGVYHKSPAKLTAIQVAEQKASDFKAMRSKMLAKYLGIEGNVCLEIANFAPKVCFVNDVVVKLNENEIEARFIKAIVGKVAGLCEKSSGICYGLGVIRDFNEEGGMLYIISPEINLGIVDCLEVFSGDGSISLEKQDIWSESLAESIEYDVPNIVTGAILAEKPHKYHPTRNFTK